VCNHLYAPSRHLVIPSQPLYTCCTSLRQLTTYFPQCQSYCGLPTPKAYPTPIPAKISWCSLCGRLLMLESRDSHLPAINMPARLMVIIFDVFQPTCDNRQTDGPSRTDRQTTCRGIIALYVSSRDKKSSLSHPINCRQPLVAIRRDRLRERLNHLLLLQYNRDAAFI